MTTQSKDWKREVSHRSDLGVHVNCVDCGRESPPYDSVVDIYNNTSRYGWARLRKNKKNVFRCDECRKE